MSGPEPSTGEPALPGTARPGHLDEPGGPHPLPVASDEAFADFYRSFVTVLVRFLIWQGAPVQVAADLAQETMIKAYRNWPRIEHPRAWARRVASRELVRHTARTEAPVACIPEPTSLLPRPDEALAWEQHHDLLQLLAGLPARQRQVMAWTYDGYSPSQIAEELGIEAATVRASLQKARRTLAARLADRGEER
jgi:RNA polymerase sigma factor (sigma-70 family)